MQTTSQANSFLLPAPEETAHYADDSALNTSIRPEPDSYKLQNNPATSTEPLEITTIYRRPLHIWSDHIEPFLISSTYRGMAAISAGLSAYILKEAVSFMAAGQTGLGMLYVGMAITPGWCAKYFWGEGTGWG